MGSKSEECPSGAEGAPSEEGSQLLLESLTRRCSGTLGCYRFRQGYREVNKRHPEAKKTGAPCTAGESQRLRVMT